MTRTIAAVCCFLPALAFPSHALAQVTGQVRGTVWDEQRRPLNRATVWLQVRRASDGDRPRPFHRWTRTTPDGQFQFTGVPGGRFAVCAGLPASDLLDSCQWDTQSPPVVVSGSAVVVAPPITLKRGYALRVRVDDPRGDLSVREYRLQGAALRLGLWTPAGLFVPMALRYKEPRGEEYEAVVPYRTPLRLMVQAQRFVLADERRAVIDRRRGARLPLVIQPGREPRMIRFEVKGVEKP